MKATKHLMLRKWAERRFAWELAVRTEVLKMNARKLKSLRKAVESRTTTNCWFGEYHILPFLRKLLDDRSESERLKKELTARAGRHFPR